MPKQNRSYKKGAPHRDARLFVIIAEGEREDTYFRWFDARSLRLNVYIIDRRNNASSPKHFTSRLSQAEEDGKYSPQDNDQVWFVCDVDRWRRQIEEMRILCDQEPNWNIAVSNKCFEVWLHFHSGPITLSKSTSCSALKRALHSTSVGDFNPDKYCPLIEQAAQYAREADTSNDSFFPNVLQTKLYKLAESMLQVLGRNW